MMAGGRDVNEKCCAKVFAGWKSPVRDLFFGGGAQIKENFLAALGMAATGKIREEKKQKKREKKWGHTCRAPTGKNVRLRRA